MVYLEKAMKDGYVYLTGEEGKQKIVYIASDNHKENYEGPEEQIKTRLIDFYKL